MLEAMPANIFTRRPTYFDALGKPLALGRLAIYLQASSTALAHVFSDSKLTMPVANPVILDSAGRAPMLYSESAAYVRVEKLMGRDEYGESIYEFVYDYETPPDFDIGSFSGAGAGASFVDTYQELRERRNFGPTFVLKEGDPHLYFWNPGLPSLGLNEVTDVSSHANPDGSWHWETKVVHADQCEIRNDGRRFDAGRLQIFAALSRQGYETRIPKGTYDFFGASVPALSFRSIHIATGVSFRNASLIVSATDFAECFSEGLPIKWTFLPADRAYSAACFSSIETTGPPVDLLINVSSFSCNKIRNALLGLSATNTAASCQIKEIIPDSPSSPWTLYFSGKCEKANNRNLNFTNYSDVSWLLVNTRLNSQYLPYVIERLSILPGGSLYGSVKARVKELASCVPSSISCPFSMEGANTDIFNLDPGILSYTGLDYQLQEPSWSAKGLRSYSNFTAQNMQVLSDSFLNKVTIPAGIVFKLNNCHIRELHLLGKTNAIISNCVVSKVYIYQRTDYGLIFNNTIILGIDFSNGSFSLDSLAVGAPIVVPEAREPRKITFRKADNLFPGIAKSFYEPNWPIYGFANRVVTAPMPCRIHHGGTIFPNLENVYRVSNLPSFVMVYIERVGPSGKPQYKIFPGGRGSAIDQSWPMKAIDPDLYEEIEIWVPQFAPAHIAELEGIT